MGSTTLGIIMLLGGCFMFWGGIRDIIKPPEGVPMPTKGIFGGLIFIVLGILLLMGKAHF